MIFPELLPLPHQIPFLALDSKNILFWRASGCPIFCCSFKSRNQKFLDNIFVVVNYAYIIWITEMTWMEYVVHFSETAILAYVVQNASLSKLVVSS